MLIQTRKAQSHWSYDDTNDTGKRNRAAYSRKPALGSKPRMAQGAPQMAQGALDAALRSIALERA